MPSHPLHDAPLAAAEFLAVDTETNGRGGDGCEMTEVGAVLLGGGELHERWSSLVTVQAPLGRVIQRFTGITQAMVDVAPPPPDVLPGLASRLEGRVLVAHNAAFDRRVLRQAFERAGLEWPSPPVLCTVALARRLMPLQERRGLAALAAALGIEVDEAHRALPDAETCGRVFCALFHRLCAHAATVGEAIALLRARRTPRTRPPKGRPAGARRATPKLDFADLPNDPGVYVFRDRNGRVLYVGKSVGVRTRAKAHFAPSGEGAEWTAQAEVVDYAPARSELGALLLESRLVKRWRPPGNRRLKPDGRLAWIVCDLDASYPLLEVAEAPAAGHAVSVGPVRGRRTASELCDQLTSLFALRHCGRVLPRRDHPSVYGQMGRCLSPCLGDLDPNAYRRRLDAALAVFSGERDGREALLAEVGRRMAEASAERRYERAGVLLRRRERLETLFGRLEGALRAIHLDARLVLARHPSRQAWDVVWLAGGRVTDWGPVPSRADLLARTDRAAAAAARPRALRPEEVDDARIVASWIDLREDTPALPLTPAPSPRRVVSWVEAETGELAGGPATPPSPIVAAHARTPRRPRRPRPGQVALIQE
jgi:DNA polymerase-3 subunit epsilon